MNAKARVATLWLDACSGCHMSFLDMDERLLNIASRIDLVYSPLVDAQDFPENVDVTLVEGAISTDEDIEKMKIVRAHTRLLVALGDCAVTGNVPSMRNSISVEDLLRTGYVENATDHPGVPKCEIPQLEPAAIPLQELVPVDLYIPGCPPPPDLIYFVLAEVLAGRTPDIATQSHFGN